MKIAFGRVLVCAFVAALGGRPAGAGGYQDGFDAYEKGNYARAYEIWLKQAQGGDSDAEFGLGVLLDNGQGVPENDSEAAKWYQAAAEKGNADAQFNLGLLYDSGSGVPVDKAQAFKWYRQAAIKGHAGAQYNLGLMYENGDGVDTDPSLAAYWYHKAAEQGHAKAQNNLGVLYDKGLGVPEDKAEAVKWYRASALQGFARGQFNLGVMYDFGSGVRLDDAEAARWYAKAAEQGDSDAQFNLALMYDSGEGVPADKAKAAKWYEAAALQGNSAAQNNLGVLLESGDGVPRDAATAAHWYQLGADQGNVSAQKNLAALYRSGTGVPQDLVAAYKWYTLAIDALASGPDREVALEERADMAEEMNRSDVREAKRQVDAWRQAREAQEQVMLPPAPPPAERARTEIDSTGSGFFVTQGGMILTSNHVVAGCADLRLKLGREDIGSATPVAADPRRDIALIRSGTSPPATALFRMGRPVRPGDDVVAVGYPLRGLLASEANVTTGGVSAMAGVHDDPEYMQITAPVQPGNSGGPLLDRAGHVIGMVSAKLDALDVASNYGDVPQNVNFAVKGDVLANFLNNAGVTPLGLPSDKELPAADVGEIAQHYSVLIECWK